MILRAAGCLLLAGAAYLYISRNFVALESGLSLPSDFSHYYEAGRQILRGGTPYSNPAFNYPPILAFLCTPLALADYITARWTWFLLSHAMLLASAFLVWRHLGRRLISACCVALVWTCGGAAGESLALGQVGPILALLLALAYTTQSATRGLAIGAGAALKVLPGILALPVLLAREWRSIVPMIASAALLVLLPMLALLGFSGPRRPQDATFLLGSPAILSWSIPSTVLRVLDPPVSTGGLPPNWEFGNQVTALRLPAAQKAASALSSITILLLGGAVLLWRTRGRIARAGLPAAMAGVLSLSLAAAPVSWSHYQVLQYPGVALLLGLAVTHRRWLQAGGIAACAALLYPIPIAVLTHYYHRYGWTAASPWQLYIWTSSTPLACLAIFAFSLFPRQEAV